MKYDHKTQVGGDHYSQGDKPQHWDLVVMYGWDYFQAQVTKYLMRWKDKHTNRIERIEDLKKARNFLDKYIAEAEKFDDHRGGPPEGMGSAPPMPDLGEFRAFEQDSPIYLHNQQFLCEGGYGDGLNLYRCNTCRMTVVARGLQEAAERHGHTGQLPPMPAAPSAAS